MANLILVRGIPGSGKSTLSDEFIKIGYRKLEADQFFIVDGVYKFDPSKIRQAHEFCQKNALEAMKRGENICISNTFTRLSEMHFYLLHAKEYNYNVYIVKATGNHPDVHNVPAETKAKMLARWEKI